MAKIDDAAEANARWMESWIGSVATGEASMSQRKRTSIDAHGGIDAAIAAARSKGVHLVQLTDDKGDILVAASREPIDTLC
jgi:hypothetical protein